MTFTLYEDIGLAPEIARHAWDIPEGEDVEIHINSCGGSVFGGMAIVAAINTLRWHGHKTRAIVEGLAASMASVVACACDEIVMHEGAMLMIHNPWTFIEGDAEELKKQAELMGKIKRDMLAVYKRKFDLPTEEISRLMDEETWISTEDIEQYRLNATVLEGTAKIAASVNKERYYSKLRERLAMAKEDENKEDKEEKTEQKPAEQKPTEEKPAEKTEEQTDEKTEEQTEEKPAEQKPAEKTDEKTDEKPADDKDKTEDEDKDEDNLEKLRERIDELTRENEELHKQLDAPVEDRVRGMQSKMQSKINAAQKEFEKQLRAKTEELATAQAKATSLQSELDKTKGELQTTASALATKTTALETLHSGVLTPHAAAPSPKTRDEARRALAKLPMNERAAYYKQHRSLIDG